MSRKLTLLLFMVLCFWLQPAALWAQSDPEQNEASPVNVSEDMLFLGKTKSLNDFFEQMTKLSALMDRADNPVSMKANLARTLGLENLDTIDLGKPAGLFVFTPANNSMPSVVFVLTLKDKGAFLEAIKRNYEPTVDKAVYSFTAKEGKPELGISALLTDNLIYACNDAEVLRGLHQWQKAGEEFTNLKTSGLSIKLFVKNFKNIIAEEIEKLEATQKSSDKPESAKQNEDQSEKLYLLSAQKIFSEAKSLTLSFNLDKDNDFIEMEYEPEPDGQFAKQLKDNEGMPSALFRAFPNNSFLAVSMRLNPETIRAIIDWHLATMPAMKTDAAAKLVNDAARKYADDLKKICGEEHAFAIIAPPKDKTGLTFISIYQIKDMPEAQKSLRAYLKSAVSSVQNSPGGPEIKLAENAGMLDKTPFDRITISVPAGEQASTPKPQDKILPALLGAQNVELNIYYQKDHIIFAAGANNSAEVKQIIGNLENPVLADNSLGKDKTLAAIRENQHPTNANLFACFSVNDLMRSMKSLLGEINVPFTKPVAPNSVPPLTLSIICDKGKLRCLICIPSEAAKHLNSLSHQQIEQEEAPAAPAKMEKDSPTPAKQ